MRRCITRSVICELGCIQNAYYGLILITTFRWSIGCLIYEMASLKPPFDGKNVVSLGKKIVKGEFAPIHSTYSDELQRLIESMLNVDSSQRPSVGQLMKNPRISKYINEGKLLVKEFQVNQRIHHKLRELKIREEELKRRENAIARREQLLAQKESELESKERRLSFEHRVHAVPSTRPALAQQRVLSKALGSKINSIDYLLHQEDHKRRLSAESSGSSTSCSTYSSSSSSGSAAREKVFLNTGQRLPYLYSSPLADLENSKNAANRLRPRTLYGR